MAMHAVNFSSMSQRPQAAAPALLPGAPVPQGFSSPAPRSSLAASVNQEVLPRKQSDFGGCLPASGELVMKLLTNYNKTTLSFQGQEGSAGQTVDLLR